MKRQFSILSLLLLSIFACAQKFEYTYQGVSFKCKVTGNDNSVTITSFPVKSIQVVIPAIVTYRDKTYAVKKVSTFLNGVNYLTKTLVLEEGIEEIDKFSFNEFRNLISVTLPSTLRHIGRNAFRNNNGLKLHLAMALNETDLRNGKEIFLTSNPYSRQQTLLAQHNTLPKITEKVNDKVSNEKKNDNKKNDKEETADIRKDQKKKPSSLPEVDLNIPVTHIKNTDTYCVIIANENYSDVPRVEYARRDGEVFKEYCVKTLGIPEKNIKTFYDATYTTIKRAINWMETTADVTEGKSKILLYYAGHGMPGEKDQMAYLIPTDGIPQDVTTCYKLSELYARLGKIKAQNVTVFMDACFSGMKRGDDKPLLSARGVAIEVKEEVLSGNTIVFTAASGDETAMAFKEKQHGLFTYFLLEKLRETGGKVSYGELFESVLSAVKKNSWLENEKKQTPSVNVSQKLETVWKKCSFNNTIN